jgi:hypothetical protein
MTTETLCTPVLSHRHQAIQSADHVAEIELKRRLITTFMQLACGCGITQADDLVAQSGKAVANGIHGGRNRRFFAGQSVHGISEVAARIVGSDLDDAVLHRNVRGDQIVHALGNPGIRAAETRFIDAMTDYATLMLNKHVVLFVFEAAQNLGHLIQLIGDVLQFVTGLQVNSLRKLSGCQRSGGSTQSAQGRRQRAGESEEKVQGGQRGNHQRDQRNRSIVLVAALSQCQLIVEGCNRAITQIKQGAHGRIARASKLRQVAS